jgi:hypothetical protein
MQYQLFEKDNAKDVVASSDCADDFAAQKWAQDWTSANAKSDEYLLERSGGGFSALMFKTVAGQWYMMRR